MTEPHFLPAVTLAGLIRRREIGCLELLEHFADRIERHDDAVNAVVVRDLDRARALAREADAAVARGEDLGPLHGVPMTVKESFDVAGLVTTRGDPTRRDRIAGKDAVVVGRLKAAGAVLLSKTNLPIHLGDWQSYNAVHGTTNNPWDLSRTPGGSSGGAAAALAAGLTALDIGTDNGNSIRNPAHCCGVFGHKSSWGIVPFAGHTVDGELAMPDIDCIGPLARSADDLEVVLDLIAGPDPTDALGWRFSLPAVVKDRLSEFTVGVLPSHPLCPPDREVAGVFASAVDALRRAGATVSERAPPIDLAAQHRLYVTLLLAAASGAMTREEVADLVTRGRGCEGNENDFHRLAGEGAGVPHRAWLSLNETRERLRRAWAGYFRDVDLLLCPVSPTVAPPHDHAGLVEDRILAVDGVQRPVTDQLFWAGIAGVVKLPATVAPVGFGRSGLPVGVQIVGPYLGDRTCIRFARLIEREFGGFAPPPGYA